jgi:hypothetical protein
LQALCDVVHADATESGPVDGASAGGRIEVKLDHLFG